MGYRVLLALGFLVLVGVNIGQILPTFYAIPLTIAFSLIVGTVLQFYVIYGWRQGLVEFIFAMPRWCMPVSLRHWAIWNDADLKLK